MKKATLGLLACPNGSPGPLRLHACEVRRDDTTLLGLSEEQLRKDDEIVRGVVANLSAGTAYPIVDCVGLMLSDLDTEADRHIGMLDAMREECFEPFRGAIDTTRARLKSRTTTADGEWNREEMAYYDRDVATPELRAQVLEDIRNNPLWNIFLPRQRHLVRHIADRCRGEFVLEVGCGNARTASWIFNPDRYGHRYVGFDISWDRLLLAKAALPAGDFFQASALNPPFRSGVFRALIAFGVFHHLPRPDAGLRACLDTLAPGGYVGLHEPINTPKLFRDGSRAKKATAKLLQSYEHSEHDNEIDLRDTLEMLKQKGANVLDVAYSHSVVRPILNRACNKLSNPGMRKRAYQLTISVDKLMIHTACKVSARLGPRAASVLAQLPS